MNIHPTATVHPKAELDVGVNVGPYAVIGEHVRLGEGTIVGPHAVIEGWTAIGQHCDIGVGAVLGGPPQDLKYRGQRSFLRIGDYTCIREYVTIHRSAEEDGVTSVGAHVFLMAYTHVAHDCRLGDHVIMVNYAGLSGYVEVEDRAFISGHNAVHQFVRIGYLAMVSGASRVVKDIPPFMIAEGNPTRIRGLNIVGMRRLGLALKVRRELRRAYGLLYRSGLNTSHALQSMRQEGLTSDEVQRLITFVEGAKRGICVGLRPRDRDTSESEEGEEDA
ncbi:MAG TPA: acyl-ACP--UDP-N-acetylglucosamine O-acyltransferase [Candidatus Tectomicrobia bacterium]|nr:acyl-ACP--UDP-N-acetylglucosamine O-acyltransferase [Candidatus Tectomicrobia bacterium]